MVIALAGWRVSRDVSVDSEAASFQALNYMDSVLNVSLSIMFAVAALAYHWLARTVVPHVLRRRRGLFQPTGCAVEHVQPR